MEIIKNFNQLTTEFRVISFLILCCLIMGTFLKGLPRFWKELFGFGIAALCAIYFVIYSDFYDLHDHSLKRPFSTISVFVILMIYPTLQRYILGLMNPKIGHR
ncbi:hypothetical protein B0O44_1124 [Pedobacter nutrimenti]|uniref:Uncharacterized protein n=1 Tax=Pedobacter nutrimenti TaxID=1241337 RepID=A0A318U6E1_9SPHI|nr:hypothetical protein B0O44_1124 [Pedobacter nutrimenti]